MVVVGDVGKRIMAILRSPSVLVVPVGNAESHDRGILTATGEKMGQLGNAVKLAFSGAVIAAALMAAPAQANGVGYDAQVYGQAQGQVMQQGSGVRMTVIGVRPVKIEVTDQARSGGANQMIGYGVTAGAAGVGGIIGGNMGNTNAQRQVGAIVGGLLGAVVGNVANNALNDSQATRMVDGVELTLENPATRQIATITQAGSQAFAEGDRVMVISTGGASRVVADRSQSQSQGRDAGQYRNPDVQGYGGPAPQGQQAARGGGQGSAQEVAAVVQAAASMGLRVDAGKIASALDSGMSERTGWHVGKIVGVDDARGLIYQSTGRGMGEVYASGSLNRVPQVGEVVTVKIRDGVGTVEGERGQMVARGGR